MPDSDTQDTLPVETETVADPSPDTAQTAHATPAINTNETWKIALEQIRLRVSPQNFTAWFKNTNLVSVENGIAVVGCVNSFARDWLENNHHTMITQTLRTVTKQNVDVQIVVNGGGANTSNSAPVARQDTPAEKTHEPVQQSPQPDRYDNLSISADEAPLFNVEFTHQNLYEDSQAKASLNKHYLFENFVVGSSNQLAHAAAEAVAERPGTSYNPFFIYGGTGLGKTHLSQAIGNRVLNENPNKKVLYVGSETFLNEMVEAIRNTENAQFRGKYRELDVLILDDVQLMSTWEKAQEELFHTFNTLHQSGRQIVLISDRPPKEIDGLADRLRSRFEGGMVTDITAPDVELRRAIVKQKAEDRGFQLPDYVLNFIAQSFSDNIRELEGAILKVGSAVRNGREVPDEKSVAKLLEIDAESKRRKVAPRDLVNTVCDEFGVSIRDVRGKGRKAEFVQPRQVAMYLLRKELELPLEQVARELNRTDHTTVMHAIERVEEQMDEDGEFGERVRGLGV